MNRISIPIIALGLLVSANSAYAEDQALMARKLMQLNNTQMDQVTAGEYTLPHVNDNGQILLLTYNDNGTLKRWKIVEQSGATASGTFMQAKTAPVKK